MTDPQQRSLILACGQNLFGKLHVSYSVWAIVTSRQSTSCSVSACYLPNEGTTYRYSTKLFASCGRPSISCVGSSIWSAWVQGAWWALLAANYLPRFSLEGSVSGGTGPVWSQLRCQAGAGCEPVCFCPGACFNVFETPRNINA